MNGYGATLEVAQPNIQGGARFDRARPARSPAMGLRMRFGRFELDEDNARLLCDGKPLELPPKPFEVLCALARRPGSLVTKDALLDEVWGHRFVSESVVKTVVGKLRIALQDDARKPRFIETVQRRGYRFIAAESLAAGGSPASPWLEHRHPPGPLPGLDAAGVAAEHVLREIREAILLVGEQPHESQSAVARIVDCIGRWVSTAANEGALLLPQAAFEVGPASVWPAPAEPQRDRNQTLR